MREKASAEAEEEEEEEEEEWRLSAISCSTASVRFRQDSHQWYSAACRSRK
jgi:hypothetical protein